MDHFTVKNTKFAYRALGATEKPQVLWGHGWGQNHQAMIPIAQSLASLGTHKVIDFPGFGKSDEPPEVWGTEDYADAIAQWINEQNIAPIIWVGHSFGGRVGIQLAARYPELVSGMFLIASAGLKPQKPLHKKLYLKFRIAIFKFLKKLIPLGLSQDWLKSKFGSSDYKSLSGIMQKIFIRTVNEDLNEQAARIKCPVTLVYGENDHETPPKMGYALEKLIKNAKMILLEGQDHYTVLQGGHHQVALLLKQFIKAL